MHVTVPKTMRSTDGCQHKKSVFWAPTLSSIIKCNAGDGLDGLDRPPGCGRLRHRDERAVSV